jgi:hypothetical protein
MAKGVHVDFDGAWDPGRLPAGVRTIDARALGPHLRYIAREKELQRAFDVLKQGLRDDTFVLYGSGDFHHLAGWWLRLVLDPLAGKTNDVRLVSFDNHPDWDVRPPRWGCGGWLNRALEHPAVGAAEVWGCGNFELAFPGRVFRNRRAIRQGRLSVFGWEERNRDRSGRVFVPISRDNWRSKFAQHARNKRGAKVYITVDMDCLAEQFAVTNWENGLFTPEDIAWAIGELRRAGAEILGGDCCGTWSESAYARRFQRFAANWDHPKLPPRTLEAARTVNHPSLDILWPALTGMTETATPPSPDPIPRPPAPPGDSPAAPA